MFFSDKKLVAIDIGTSTVKLAEVDQSSKGPILTRFSVLPLNANMVQGGEIIDVEGVARVIKELVAAGRTKRKNVATALWGNAVIVKKIGMPKMDPKLVAEQLKWEAEQYIPFSINEISLEYHILSTRSTAEAMDVLLVAAKQDFVFRVIEAIESAQMKCAVVDVAGFALANCFEKNYGTQDKPVALLNLGGGVTNFVVVEKGEVILCRDIAVGGSNYTSEIAKSMGISFQEAESLKISASTGQAVPDEVMSIIKSTNEQFLDEIRNSFEFFTSTANGNQISRFYVSGGSVFLPGLVEQVAKVSGIPFEPFDPFQKILYDNKTFSLDYIDQIKAITPVALGLAMRKMSDS